MNDIIRHVALSQMHKAAAADRIYSKVMHKVAVSRALGTLYKAAQAVQTGAPQSVPSDIPAWKKARQAIRQQEAEDAKVRFSKSTGGGGGYMGAGSSGAISYTDPAEARLQRLAAKNPNLSKGVQHRGRASAWDNISSASGQAATGFANGLLSILSIPAGLKDGIFTGAGHALTDLVHGRNPYNGFTRGFGKGWDRALGTEYLKQALKNYQDWNRDDFITRNSIDPEKANVKWYDIRNPDYFSSDNMTMLGFDGGSKLTETAGEYLAFDGVLKGLGGAVKAGLKHMPRVASKMPGFVQRWAGVGGTPTAGAGAAGTAAETAGAATGAAESAGAANTDVASRAAKMFRDRLPPGSPAAQQQMADAAARGFAANGARAAGTAAETATSSAAVAKPGLWRAHGWPATKWVGGKLINYGLPTLDVVHRGQEARAANEAWKQLRSGELPGSETRRGTYQFFRDEYGNPGYLNPNANDPGRNVDAGSF